MAPPTPESQANTPQQDTPEAPDWVDRAITHVNNIYKLIQFQDPKLLELEADIVWGVYIRSLIRLTFGDKEDLRRALVRKSLRLKL